jgi:DNA-binding winged helix-turn-helix (wHTH) protein/TolB-like protein
MPVANDLFLFGGFRLDRRNGGLFRKDAAGGSVAVAVGSRALDVLTVLVGHPGELVSKDAIMNAVWPDVVIEEKNLTVQISALRRVLDDGRKDGSCIQTEAGRGYRFVAAVARPDEDGGTIVPPESVVCDATGECPPTPAAPAVARAALPLWVLLAIATAGAGGLLVGAAGTAWWLSHHETVAKIPSQESPRPVAYSPQDRRSSVIVLPFENSSGDPAQDSVAAGITRDVTDLINADNYNPTIPAPMAAAYRGKAIDLKTIGQEHDVHFAIIGNARREAGRLIVAANVYGTTDGGQIWAKRFDLPDTPDEWKTIIRDISSNSGQAATDSESARALREHPDDLDKRDLMFAEAATPLSQVSEANLLAQLALIERALTLDPDYVVALRERARKLAQMVMHGFSSDRDRDLAIAVKSVERALLINPDDYWTLREKAVVLYAQRNYNEAAALLRRLIKRRPQAFRYLQLANILMIQGHYSDASENFNTARRMAVGSDSINTLDAGVAFGLLGNDRFSEAIEQARLAITEFPPDSGRDGEHPWLILIAAESISQHEEEARVDLNRFLATPRKLRSMTELEKLPLYASNPKLLEGLRHAGMPVE